MDYGNGYGALSRPRVTPSLYKLTIELIPERQWGVNLRAMMSAHQWGKIRRQVYARTGGVCEICAGTGYRGRLDCHERWKYDEANRRQTLIGLIALCPRCHQVKHLGFAQKLGKLDEAIEHMIRVNGMSKAEARAYLEWAYAAQRRRAAMRWATDVAWFESEFPGVLSKRSTPILPTIASSKYPQPGPPTA